MRYDVIVVGTGQAAVPLAVALAGSGRTVLVAERSRVGGTCINYGCTPTKTLVASARAAHVARTAERLGVRAGPVEVDFAAVMARKDAMVRQWRYGVEKRLSGAGPRLSLVRSHARFVGERELEVGGERHRGEVVILNVGTRPAPPPIPGGQALPWLDNRRVMELAAPPTHLLVLGGGYIGCELGQVFRRLGARVTIVQRPPHLLDREDPEVSGVVEEVFRAEGIELVLGASVKSAVGRDHDVVLALDGGGEIAGSHLLAAVGRRPNTDDLGCAEGGVALDARGFVKVDDQYRTSALGVYAVGDVTGGPQFTHTSWDDHRILLDVLEGRPARSRSGRVIPYCVFTDPQVSGVGLNEREAKTRGVAYRVATMPFNQVTRAIETGETAGILKVLVRPDDGRILGASLVGAEVGELVHVFAALMQAGAPIRAVVDMEVAHPTFAEGLQAVALRLPA
ncbi:MAG TPA: mercuric reductase [Anaeromyxobacter sp.]|nr:mercuric reductase [Anaeromyxobacter sp.]